MPVINAYCRNEQAVPPQPRLGVEARRQGPTLREQGVKDFTASTWLMLMYPAGVPQSMVDDSFAVLKKVADTPDFKQRLRAIGALPRFSASPAEAHAYVQSEYKYWGEVVKRSGVSLS